MSRPIDRRSFLGGLASLFVAGSFLPRPKVRTIVLDEMRFTETHRFPAPDGIGAYGRSIDDLVGRVNARQWKGFTPGQCRLESVMETIDEKRPGWCFVTIAFHCSQRGWEGLRSGDFGRLKIGV